MEDPTSSPPDSECECEEEILLPTPKTSPKRKKGMTAEQVKHARDLCTTCHAALKLLALVFTLPSVYRVFSDAQLGAILTQVLAIPLAPELPTPNARKTYALSIWLLQVQRLPAEVLVPAKDRIAYALRRGIEGELGKEGKKGSASDGLKAIYDLSVYQPSTFIPVFTELLPSVLENLLAPTLALRTQACHALGGFVIGCTSQAHSHSHTRISNAVSAFVVFPSPPTRKGTPNSSQESAIVRTLRTTLNAIEPQHPAQGPVWALCVIANLVVLMGSGLTKDRKLIHNIHVLLNLARRHQKSTIRALACIVWRCLTWTYFQPTLVEEDGGELQMEPDSPMTKNSARAREEHWNIIMQELELGVGVSTMAALLGNESTQEDALKKALHILDEMIGHGGHTALVGFDTFKQLISLDTPALDWHVNKLLPRSLFATNPGLLTADYKCLASVVKPILDQCPQVEEVRPLTREEIATEWIFSDLVNIWKKALGQIDLDKPEASSEINLVWERLLKAKVATMQDAAEEHDINRFAEEAVHIIADVLHSKSQAELIDRVSSSLLRSSPSISPISKGVGCQMLSIIHELWKTTHAVISSSTQCKARDRLLASLMELEADLVEATDESRQAWALLCTDIVLACDMEDVEAFWETKCHNRAGSGLHDTSLSLLWNSFIRRWRADGEATWEGSIFLLGVPFADATAWDLTNDDLEAWDDFLRFTMDKALDVGIDAVAVLDHVAEAVSKNHCPGFISCTRVADLLLGHLDITDARQVPDSFFTFVNDVLISTYPPEPRNKIASMWMIRSFTHVMDACPCELRLNLLQVVQDGLCIWITDQRKTITEEEYLFDILPLYQTILASMQSLSLSLPILEALSPVLEAPFRSLRRNALVAADPFRTFWEATFAAKPRPVDGWPIHVQACLDSISDLKLDETGCNAGGSPVFSKNGAAAGPLNHENENEESTADASACQDSKATPVNLDKGLVLDPLFLFSGLGPDLIRTIVPKETVGAVTTPASPPAIFRPHTLPDQPLTNRITRTRTFASTPPRPQKTSVFASTSQFMTRCSPSSPLSLGHCAPTTPRRTSGPIFGSSSARRKMGNKENILPWPVITSVAERITMSSSTPMNTSVLGKRKAVGDQDQRATKKDKGDSSLASSLVSDNDDETAINVLDRSPIIDVFTAPRREIKPLPSSSRTCTGVFMDAVELPTLQQVNRRLRHRSQSRKIIDPVKSEEKELCDESSLKRRRSDDIDMFPSTPLRPLQKMRFENNGELILSPGEPPSEGSSDDDPHLGQVTPHRVISPQLLRRPRLDNCDPPSDDSAISASPSRDAVARRTLRPSLAKLLPLAFLQE